MKLTKMMMPLNEIKQIRCYSVFMPFRRGNWSMATNQVLESVDINCYKKKLLHQYNQFVDVSNVFLHYIYNCIMISPMHVLKRQFCFTSVIFQ